MINPDDDGITHINIYSKGQTELGRLLTNFAAISFTVPEHGMFASVEGYWYWLTCRNDRLRKLTGFMAKKAGRELRGQDWVEDPEFKSRILVALQAKVEQNPQLKKFLTESKLPFKHYYVFGATVHDETERCQWMLDEFERIRTI